MSKFVSVVAKVPRIESILFDGTAEAIELIEGKLTVHSVGLPMEVNSDDGETGKMVTSCIRIGGGTPKTLKYGETLVLDYNSGDFEIMSQVAYDDNYEVVSPPTLTKSAPAKPKASKAKTKDK